MALGMSMLKVMSAAREQNRKRGNIEERGGALRVRLYAGTDPVTGKQVYYRDTIQGTNKAAWKKAENKLAEFQAKVAKQRSAQSSVSLAYALSEWMRTNELAKSTRKTCEGYIDRTIVPALGETPVNKLSARILEGLYTELRRCRTAATASHSSCTSAPASTTAKQPAASLTERSPMTCSSSPAPRPPTMPSRIHPTPSHSGTRTWPTASTLTPTCTLSATTPPPNSSRRALTSQQSPVASATAEAG